MESDGFQEPRLVLFSPSAAGKDAVGNASAKPLTVHQLKSRRRSATIRNGFDVAKAAARGADVPGLAPISSGHPSVPTDIIVANHSNKGISSEQSAVSEITQPIELIVSRPASRTVRDTRDISEMKRRLEKIKERRARILGEKQPDIPSQLVIRKQQSTSSSKNVPQASNPQQSYRARQVEKVVVAKEEKPRQALNHPMQAQPQRKPSFARQRSSIDPPEQAADVAVAADAFEPFKASPGSTKEAPEEVMASQPSNAVVHVDPSPPPTPVTPPRKGKELQQFKSSITSLSPKSAGVSTCHTFDETMEGSYDDSFHHRDPSWTLKRLICKPKSSQPSRIDTGFGQIRATKSLDYFGSSARNLDAEDPPETNAAKTRDQLPLQQPRVSRRSTFDETFAVPPLQEEHVDKARDVNEDNGNVTDANGFLIGRAALRNGRFTEYPRPPLPGKAYSEILSEKSSLGPEDVTSSSCLRRDPWYMTRRMKQQQKRAQEIDNEKGVMHTVVFVNKKS